MLKYLCLMFLTFSVLASDVTDNASERIPDPVALGVTYGDNSTQELVKAVLVVDDEVTPEEVVNTFIKNYTPKIDEGKWEKDFKDQLNTKMVDNPDITEQAAANTILYVNLMRLAFIKPCDYTNKDVLMIFRFIKVYTELGLELPSGIKNHMSSNNLLRLAYGRW